MDVKQHFVWWKKITIGLIGILLCVVVDAQVATQTQKVVQPSVKKVLNIQTWQTTNGAHVYFVQAKELPIIDIGVVFDAGSARDELKPGLAQFVSAMLNQGTATLNADQIANRFDAVGAQYGANTDRDKTVVSLRSLVDPKYLDSSVQTYIDLLTHANFPQNAFQRTQQQVLAALQSEDQQPSVIAQKAFVKALYNGQPYGHPVMGTAASVSSITPQDLQNFYKQYYVAKNAQIIIVGDLTSEQANALSGKIAGQMPEGNPAPHLATVKPLTQAIVEHISFPANQTTVYLGELGINSNDPDFFPLMVGNNILGDSGTLSSRLYKEVREKKGLVYGISSVFAPWQVKGPFYIGFQTRTSETQEAIVLAKKVLDNFIQNGPTSQELIAAQKNIIGSFPMGLTSNASIASAVTNIAFYHLPLNYLDTYREKIAAVTSQQIQDTFKRRIHPNSMVLVTVGENASASGANESPIANTNSAQVPQSSASAPPAPSTNANTQQQ